MVPGDEEIIKGINITKEQLEEFKDKLNIDIINSFTGRKNGERFFDLDNIKSDEALFNTIYSQTKHKNKDFEIDIQIS